MWFIAACSSAPIGVRPSSPDDAPIPPVDSPSPVAAGDTTARDTATSETATSETGIVPSGPCPPEMALVDGSVCVDRWEAHLSGWSPYEVPSGGTAVSQAGVVPQGYLSGDVAAAACAAASKRLCTLDEWLLACSGAEDRRYPYGDRYLPGACNEGRETHPVIEVFGLDATWSSSELNDPRLNQLPDGLAPAGSFPGCATPDGIDDLHGNLHEWIDDPLGTFKGGFYVDATINGAGCSYTTTAHTSSYHDYSTGFRCCADPSPP